MDVQKNDFPFVQPEHSTSHPIKIGEKSSHLSSHINATIPNSNVLNSEQTKVQRAFENNIETNSQEMKATLGKLNGIARDVHPIQLEQITITYTTDQGILETIVINADQIEEYTDLYKDYENFQIKSTSENANEIEASMSADELADIEAKLDDLISIMDTNDPEILKNMIYVLLSENDEAIETKSFAEAQKHEREGGLVKTKKNANDRIFFSIMEQQQYNIIGINFVVIPESLAAKLEKYNNLIIKLLRFDIEATEEEKPVDDLQQIIMTHKNHHIEKQLQKEDSKHLLQLNTFSKSSISSFIATMKLLARELETYHRKKQRENEELTATRDKSKEIENKEIFSQQMKSAQLKKLTENERLGKSNVKTEKTEEEFVEKVSIDENATISNKVEDAVETDKGFNPYNELKDRSSPHSPKNPKKF